MVAPGRIELPRPRVGVTFPRQREGVGRSQVRIRRNLLSAILFKSDSSDSTLNVKVIAEKIKSNFDKFRVEFDGGSSMDKDLGSVLGEIFKWYLNKVA